jgi:hypothetical protein
MAEFFEVKGNGNLIEALSREGFSVDDGFFPALFGPYTTLSGFANPGTISSIGGQADDYPSSGLFDFPDFSDIEIDSSIDDMFPSSLKHNITIVTSFEGDTKKAYKVSSTRAVVISDMSTGLLLQDVDIQLKSITVDSYKAHLVAGSVEVDSTPTIPWTTDGRSGTPNPPDGFNISFFTPSFTGDVGSSTIKFKVWAPAAGFEFTNVYWVWKETIYKKSNETRETSPEVVIPAVLDADGNVITPAEVIPAETVTKVVWKEDGVNMCSEQLKIVSIKDPAAVGTTDFIVYDTVGPAASQFEVKKSADEPTNTNFADDGETALEFDLLVADTNPFFSNEFAGELATNKEGQKIPYPQAHDKVALKIFYTYPVYNFSPKSDITMENLRNDGYGLVDLQDLSVKSPIFKTYEYETQWRWKEAEVTEFTVENSAPKGSPKYNGSETRIKGKMLIKQPKPWHEVNDNDPTANSDPLPKFKVMAIAKDSAGHACMLYDQVAASDDATTYAAKGDGADPEAYNPQTGASIPAGSFASRIGTSIDKNRWSNLAYLKSTDTTAPEIQVIVFDTRTNKYHLFGCKDGTDAEFSEFGTVNKTDYSTDYPYLGSNISVIDDGHKFESLTDLDALYTRYISNDPAVSTVADAADKNLGFVCQKNSRLVFYIRAFDNINMTDRNKKFGVKTLNFTITDKDGPLPTKDISNLSDILKAQEHVFRFDNVDSSPYNLSVTATDYANNERTLSLDIAVMGRSLDIRTLEERRKRFFD